MLSLPAVQGRFPVGVTTFVTPVRPARRIGTAKLKRPSIGQSNGIDTQHALQLEEVAFTAYYPTDTSGNPPTGVNWLLRPLHASLLGLSKYLRVSPWLLWPVVYLFGSLIKIPVFRNAPLLHPEKVKKEAWPLVIFSHGLGGSRTTYSQFCSRIAASGKVVLALEHRDGTGVAYMPGRWDSKDKDLHEPVVYLHEADVLCANDDPAKPHPMPFRGEQLAFRHHEIHIMYERFCDFIENDHVELEPVDVVTMVDRESWTSEMISGRSIINYDEHVILTGHSFGGATALSLLSTAPIEVYRRIPITKVIVLDPWLEPLPTPGPVPYSTIEEAEAKQGITSLEAAVQSFVEKNISDTDSRIDASLEPPDLLVINSETFTLWKDHFARLQEIVSGWVPQGGRIITLIGSKHVSFSDFPVLPIVRRSHALILIDRICHLSLAFLNETLDEALEEVPTRNIDIEIVGNKPDGKPKRKLVGNVGDIIVS